MNCVLDDLYFMITVIILYEPQITLIPQQNSYL